MYDMLICDYKMSTIKEFMDSPLVSWVRTFESDGGRSLTYNALSDGVFLYDVLTHLSQQNEVVTVARPLNRCPEGPTSRLTNLASLLAFLRAFYQDIIGQTVLATPPDVISVSKCPDTETGLKGIHKLLLLVLGCAVQSPLKEEVVLKIKELPVETQHGIVKHIQQITEDPEVVWPPEWTSLENVPPHSAEKAFWLLIAHCKRLVNERDHFHQELLKSILGLTEKRPEEQESEEDTRRASLQVADLKGKLRRLRQEHDEKIETLLELREELEHSKLNVDRLRQENIDLAQDARAARALRDEADILRERAAKVDSLETEISRYRDKMIDIDFYKSRIEELREDNRILSETKDMLEDQLASSRRRAEQVLELENQILAQKQTINHLTIEREGDRQRIEDLLQENAELQLQARNCLNESSSLAAHVERLRQETCDGDSAGENIAQNLDGEARSKALRLELENRRLEEKIDHLKQAALVSTCEDGFLQLQKDNKRLSTKLSHVENLLEKERSKNAEGQQKVLQAEQKIKLLTTEVDDVKEECERKEKDLQAEFDHLQKQMESIRCRQIETEEERLSAIRKENKQLEKNASVLQSHVSKLEAERAQLIKNSEIFATIKQHNHDLVQENSDLSKVVESYKENQLRQEQLERSLASLEVEYSRTSSALECSKQTINELESVRKENLSLQSDIKKLQSDCISATARSNQLEVDLSASKSDIIKLKKNLASSDKRNHEMEKEKGEMEAENIKLLRTVETLKLTTKRLNEVEKELTEVEASKDRISRENRSLRKEVERLKNSLEIHQSALEETSTKASKFERENKKLQQNIRKNEEYDNRLRELEQQRFELEQKSMIERETLSALREELVAEKIRTQQLSNQLEAFSTDLTKYGINIDQYLRDVANGETRTLNLGEALAKGSSVHEGKIVTLEGRLTEASVQIQHLKDQLLKSRTDCEVLRQKHWDTSEPEKEMEKVKEELTRVQEEVGTLDNQINKFTKHNLALLGENATLQVQATSLESKTNSLLSQNESLQKEIALVEADREKIKIGFDDQSARLVQLTSEFEAMQNLHQQLTGDYDALRTELNNLKTTHKSLKTEAKCMKDRENRLTENEDELLRLRENFDEEIETLKKDSTSLANLRAEHSRLKDDFRALFTEAGRLRGEAKKQESMAFEANRAKRETELSLLKLKGEIAESQDTLATLDIQYAKMTHKCQVLEDANLSLETDRRSLMEQVSLLLTQYHDLLTQTLHDKQVYHNEEKIFTDKLNNLQRQKEKLEEKIMDHYRRIDNSPHKKKGFGSSIVRKVRRAGNELISKTTRSRSRGRGDSSSASTPDSESEGPTTPPDGHVDAFHEGSLLNGLIAPSIGRGSLSSEDIGGGSVDSNREEDSLSSVSTGDFSRAGCRRPVCLTEDSQNDISAVRRSLRRTTLPRANNLNGSTLSSINGSPARVPQCPPAPISSTPSPKDSPTPQLPPRTDQNTAPQLPPRSSRRVSNVYDSSGSGTPETRRRPPPTPPLPPKNSSTPDGSKPNPVWYEYGCV